MGNWQPLCNYCHLQHWSGAAANVSAKGCSVCTVGLSFLGCYFLNDDRRRRRRMSPTICDVHMIPSSIRRSHSNSSSQISVRIKSSHAHAHPHKWGQLSVLALLAAASVIYLCFASLPVTLIFQLHGPLRTVSDKQTHTHTKHTEHTHRLLQGDNAGPWAHLGGGSLHRTWHWCDRIIRCRWRVISLNCSYGSLERRRSEWGG